MAHDGDTKYPVHEGLFSQAELAAVLGETEDTLENWNRFKHLVPTSYVLGPRRTPQKRYSIMAMVRAKIISHCVSDIGLKPSHAVEIAEFALPFLNDKFDRHVDGTAVSLARIYIISRLIDGKVSSVPVYQHPQNITAIYADDPNRNPDAPPVWIDYPAIIIPASTIFTLVFLKATEMLAKQNRAGLDKYGRPLENA